MKKKKIINFKQECIKKLKSLTRCDYVEFTKSGDHAIKTAFRAMKDMGYNSITIPDQGGWMNYEKIAKQTKLILKTIKTDYGVLSKEDLTKKLRSLIIADPAGYFARQKVTMGLRRNVNFLILDVCGSIGKPYIKRFQAEIYFASFNKWKPINLGRGGFIATNKKLVYNKIIKNLDEVDFNDKFYEDLYMKLTFLSSRYRLFEKHCKKIKRDLKDYEILHKEDDGINVVIKYNTEKEKKELIQYCKDKNYEYTECPRYIRVLEKAISIEVKRL